MNTKPVIRASTEAALLTAVYVYLTPNGDANLEPSFYIFPAPPVAPPSGAAEVG